MLIVVFKSFIGKDELQTDYKCSSMLKILQFTALTLNQIFAGYGIIKGLKFLVSHDPTVHNPTKRMCLHIP